MSRHHPPCRAWSPSPPCAQVELSQSDVGPEGQVGALAMFDPSALGRTPGVVAKSDGRVAGISEIEIRKLMEVGQAENSTVAHKMLLLLGNLAMSEATATGLSKSSEQAGQAVFGKVGGQNDRRASGMHNVEVHMRTAFSEAGMGLAYTCTHTAHQGS